MKHPLARVAAILFGATLFGCDRPTSAEPPARGKWEGYTEHERIFECLYSGEFRRFPDSVSPTEDYALIILGHRESPDSHPKIAAVLGTRESRTIETAVGLDAMRVLFRRIKPDSTIRRYSKCTAPLTYDVPENEVESAEALIPSGLIWSGTFDENMICTCPKT